MFGIRSTKYLQETCIVIMSVNQKSENFKILVFIATLEQVHTELI